MKSGRTVNSVLLGYAAKLSKDDLGRSLILDIDDVNHKRLFSAVEWEEITKESHLKDLESLDPDLLNFINDYRQPDLQSLRSKLMERWLPQDTKYDHQAHYDRDWFVDTLKTFASFWENDTNALQDENSEVWIMVNVWSKLCDGLFRNVSGLRIARGETDSCSSSDRRNTGRTLSSTKRMGARVDGMIFRRTNSLEILAMEASKMDDAEFATKTLEDKYKLGRLLKDMLTRIIARVKPCNIDQAASLESWGLLISGFDARICAMRLGPGGCVVYRTAKKDLHSEGIRWSTGSDLRHARDAQTEETYNLSS